MTDPKPSAIPFAGLAPDARTLRGGGELSLFDFEGAVDLGRKIRRASPSGGSTERVASNVVDCLNAFEHDRRPACVLVRTFVTRPFARLSGSLQEAAHAAGPTHAGDAPYLELVATRGVEPEWNEIETSRDHRAVSLAGEVAPMVVDLARQLHLGASSAPPASTFYIADAATSAAVTAKSFVASYDVRSVVGFGTTAWPGETLVAIAFLRPFVERSAVAALETVALYTKLSWIDTREAREALGEAGQELAREAALEELVSSHEARIGAELFDARRRLEAARLDGERIARAGQEQLEAQNTHLRRTQRAMVNVVEDLREARSALASKVEERTHELALANQQLESRNRDLEEFVYIASHDLQEPLRTIAGYLQMIERRYGAQLGVEADEFIRFAIDGAQRMQSLIESLLVYSRVATKDNRSEPMKLDDALDDALKNLARLVAESGAVIDRAPLPSVRADRVQMVQLFQNLIANAIKFSGPENPRIRVTGGVDVPSCWFAVRDEGIGFQQKYVDRIFKIFRRLRRDTAGTGIGLAVCQKIVERHGGRIEALSAPGEGATFTIHLPYDPSLTGTP